MDERERDEDELPVDERDEGSFATRVIPDLFRRALMTGIGTVFMSEEGIRSTLSDMKMPKEAMNYVVNQADRTKRELISTLARELRSFLNDLELAELISKGFEGKTFEIHTTIKVHGREEGEPRFEVSSETDVHDRAEGDAHAKASSHKGKKRPQKRRTTRKKTDEGGEAT